MISYQLFTQSAVSSVMELIKSPFPQVASWMNSRMDLIVFVYAFAWIFVLTSVIPTAILGRERSVIVQFIVVLTLTARFFRSRRSVNFSRRILGKDIRAYMVLAEPLYVIPAHVSSSRASARHVGEITFVVLELRPLILKRNFP